MSLIKGDPFKELMELRDEVDRLFSDTLFRRRGRERRLPMERMWQPLVDIYETKDDLVVKAELPGMKKEEITITISGDTLTIKGERKHSREIKEENHHLVERSYGAFQRAIELPVEVMGDKAEATYKDGILEIKIPKSEAAKPKEISIKVE